MWPPGSRHRLWPPEPSNREYRWRCSVDRSSYPAVPTLQSQLKHKKKTFQNNHSRCIFMRCFCGCVICACVYLWLCVIAPQPCLEACGCAWITTVHVSLCHTQFDFSILCEQNILSLNVSVNHMMGVEMGKTLEDKHTPTWTQIHSQMATSTINTKSQAFLWKRRSIVCLFLKRNNGQRVDFIWSLLPCFSLPGKF